MYLVNLKRSNGNDEYYGLTIKLNVMIILVLTADIDDNVDVRCDDDSVLTLSGVI